MLTQLRQEMGGKNMKKEKTESWRDRIIRKIADLRVEISKPEIRSDEY
jgi:hypothetical protein